MAAPSAVADPAPPPPGPAVGEPAGDTPEGTPHLASPDNLPPGTSDVPVGPQQGRGVSYLRDIWHAMQTQDVTFNEALFLLAQRPLDPAAPPPPGLAPGPQPAPPPAG
ncbi:dopamine receptor D4 [Mycolicibacterium sp. XJ870]